VGVGNGASAAFTRGVVRKVIRAQVNLQTSNLSMADTQINYSGLIENIVTSAENTDVDRKTKNIFQKFEADKLHYYQFYLTGVVRPYVSGSVWILPSSSKRSLDFNCFVTYL
jgi:hypothetical protein